MLCGLAEPIDLVSTFEMPADSTTARTAPPAMIPVPSGAGLSSTWPAPKRPSTGCGTVDPASGTRISDFFADSIPFLIADGTSFALPTPNPTTPCASPTTTRALKLRFLPPLTTLVTRLMLTTVSFRSSCDGSIFSRVSIMCLASSYPLPASRFPLSACCLAGSWEREASLELQPRLARRLGDRADAPVIQEPAAVENDALDALGHQALGDGLAEHLRPRLVAGPRGAGELALERRLRACRR